VFIPIRDENRLKIIDFQWVTLPLIAVYSFVFGWQQAFDPAELAGLRLRFGVTPAYFFTERPLDLQVQGWNDWLRLVGYTFFHGSWLHLSGNLLFLWVFGDNVEDAMGHVRFFLFYVVCGASAAVVQSALEPDSVSPIIGASGAISGVLGAYLVLHPDVKVKALLLKWLPVRLPVYLLLPGWLLLQLASGFSRTGDVAWWAHLGGFVTGAALLLPLRSARVRLFGSRWRDGRGSSD